MPRSHILFLTTSRHILRSKALLVLIILLPIILGDQNSAMCDLIASTTISSATKYTSWSCSNGVPKSAICTWQGIICLSNAVSAIQIEGQKISGTIPTSLAFLTGLQLLDMNNNALTGTIPTQLGLLSAITGMYLYGNQLTGKIPTSLALMSACQYLELG